MKVARSSIIHYYVSYAGLNVLFFSGDDEFISDEAYDVLIPAVKETLMTVQSPYP